MIDRNKCIPDGYRGALIITWDYELQKGVDSSLSSRRNWGMDDYTETKRLLEVLDKYSVRCTFFCLGYVAMGNLRYGGSMERKPSRSKRHLN